MSKRLEAMRANPNADWTIGDVRAVCAQFDLRCSPGRGSHWRVSHASQVKHLTIQAKRPIKAVYIRALVRLIDQVRSAE